MQIEITIFAKKILFFFKKREEFFPYIKASGNSRSGQKAPVLMLIMFAITIIIMVTQHIPTMTKSHHGVSNDEGVSVKNPPYTIHHDELYFGVYM